MTEPTTADANDLLFGSGIPPAQFVHPGDTYAGKITKLDAIQQRKFDKGKPTTELDFWPDGSRKMMPVINVVTAHRDPEDPADDGERKIYAASRDMQKKIRDAVKAAGAKRLDLGGWLRVTLVGEERREGTSVLAKIYEVEYLPPGAQEAQSALGLEDTRNGQTSAPATRPQVDLGGSDLPPDVLAKVRAMYASQQGAQ